MSQHTPGPWRTGKSPREHRLIAAAREMYTQLELLCSLEEYGFIGLHPSKHAADVVKLIDAFKSSRDLLAKVKGKENK